MPEHGVIGFASLRGHERVRDRLRAALDHERLAHALLFTGADGIGKRGFAMALAAFLQCEQRGDDACGSCASCRRVAAGSHPDVHSVAVAAGKREIGVDRARALKRFMQLQPACGRAKVAIIDDAPSLSVAAQNALLKTLEEPPPRSVLILVAHSADALLPTVRSRCQLIRFAPLPEEIVAEILAEHGIAPPVALEMVRLADGSPGRALLLSRHLDADASASLTAELAALGGARYVALMHVAQALNQPETALGVKLEVCLAHLRDTAVQVLDEEAACRSALRRAELVHEVNAAIRRGTPNRQLLLEALLLRMARI
jgi:DNA polymerase-3 subunit delta'